MSDRNLDAARIKKLVRFRIFQFSPCPPPSPRSLPHNSHHDFLSGPRAARCDLNVERVMRYRPYSMPDLTARLHAMHVYIHTHGDVCRSNRNGIPRINNALCVVLLDTRTIAVAVIVNAHEINNHVFVTMHATWARLYSRSSLEACARARAHAYARTHAPRTHALADLGQTEMEFRLIMQIHARTRLSIRLVDGFRAFRYYFKCWWKSICFSLSLSLSMDNINEVSRHVLCRQIRFSLFWELYTRARTLHIFLMYVLVLCMCARNARESSRISVSLAHVNGWCETCTKFDARIDVSLPQCMLHFPTVMSLRISAILNEIMRALATFPAYIYIYIYIDM